MSKMVPVKVWGCPQHDYPQTHECDCSRCEIPYYTCPICEFAKWDDKLDADGNVVMRESTMMDMLGEMSMRYVAEQLSRPMLFTAPIAAHTNKESK